MLNNPSLHIKSSSHEITLIFQLFRQRLTKNHPQPPIRKNPRLNLRVPKPLLPATKPTCHIPRHHLTKHRLIRLCRGRIPAEHSEQLRRAELARDIHLINRAVEPRDHIAQPQRFRVLQPERARVTPRPFSQRESPRSQRLPLNRFGLLFQPLIETDRSRNLPIHRRPRAFRYLIPVLSQLFPAASDRNSRRSTIRMRRRSRPPVQLIGHPITILTNRHRPIVQRRHPLHPGQHVLVRLPDQRIQPLSRARPWFREICAFSPAESEPSALRVNPIPMKTRWHTQRYRLRSFPDDVRQGASLLLRDNSHKKHIFWDYITHSRCQM